MSADKHDVIIIGAGAGGSFAALRLAKAGLKVLLIERGPRFDPSKDYYLNEPEWEFKDPFVKHIPDTYVSVPKPLSSKFSHIKSTLFKNEFTSREFSYERACGVGGSTLKYQAEAHRFPPQAFKMKSLFNVGADWPIKYEDIAPYYEQAEQILGVAGTKHDLFPKETPYPNPPHPLSCASQKVAAGCKKLGFNLVQNSLAILSRPIEGRLACVYCKLCSKGCMIGDKSSTDVAVLPYAEVTGNLNLIADTAVIKILIDKKGKAKGVLAVNMKDQKEYVFQSRAIVLASGAIETPRLLLNSRNKFYPDGLLNNNGIVGAYLMDNIFAAVLFLFSEKVHSYKGVSIDSRVWDFMVPKPAQGQDRGFSLGSAGAPDGLIGPASFAMKIADGYGRKHREFVEKYYGAHSMVFGIAEHLPKKTNRVGIDKNEKDKLGMPKARVDVTLDSSDHKIIEKMLTLCKDIANASGAEKIISHYTTYDVSSATHVSGTVRMGLKSRESAVNSYGQGHSIKNLFVADASVLPTQGCGASPSLTIQALALRTADHILSEFKKKNL